MVTVLVVDDVQMERRRVGALLERHALADFDPPDPPKVIYAGTVNDALEKVREGKIDLVVTDLLMPGSDGLALVRAVRASHPHIPVVLTTAHGNEQIAAEALHAGAAGYVSKRHLVRDLRSTVENLLGLARAAQQERHVLHCLVHSEASFLLNNDLSLVSPLVTYLQGSLRKVRICDDVGELRVTVALREALLNAIVHGNLELSSELRESDDKLFNAALAERMVEEPYRDRHVHVLVRETPDAVTYVIRDEGCGFDPASLPDPTDPANLEKCSGRGLFLIRAFMDEVSHNGQGNEITMVKRKDNGAVAVPMQQTA